MTVQGTSICAKYAAINSTLGHMAASRLNATDSESFLKRYQDYCSRAPMITERAEEERRFFSASWLFLSLILIFVVLVRLRLLGFPLERDEGEYAYMGQLILQGIPPYMSAYNMKFPGTYAMYAIIMSVFGQNIQAIHIGLILVNCAAIFLVFLLARRLLGDAGALSATAAYAVLSLSSSILGFAAHATHFVVLPALGGVLALLSAVDKDKKSTFFSLVCCLGWQF